MATPKLDTGTMLKLAGVLVTIGILVGSIGHIVTRQTAHEAFARDEYARTGEVNQEFETVTKELEAIRRENALQFGYLADALTRIEKRLDKDP